MKTDPSGPVAQGYMDRVLVLMNPEGSQRDEVVARLKKKGVSNADGRVLVAPLKGKQSKINAILIIRGWFTGNDWKTYLDDFESISRRASTKQLVFDPSDNPMLGEEQPENVIVSSSLDELINNAAELMSRKVHVIA
ncbi:MAG: hypothetical protein AAB478_03230 [Patescibacteria group bacterium]